MNQLAGWKEERKGVTRFFSLAVTNHLKNVQLVAETVRYYE